MTQAVLMLSQLILLPIQVRLWGQADTAVWYSALAFATMTYFVDCGLRTAGHSELLKASADPRRYESELDTFRQIWSWIRILILLVTGVLVCADFIASRLLHSGQFAAWHAVLTLACATETVLIIRITYLDTLGHYRGAEASYFSFAVLRLLLSVPGLLFFHWKAPGLAVIYLLTGLIALMTQGYWLCRDVPVLHLTAGISRLSWSALALARHTVAEPIANWARLSLPVLIIGQIAPPMAVTTYVALRAVFGAGRTTIQQLARVASVEVVKSRNEGQDKRSGTLMTLFVALAICFGSGVAFFVIADNLRLLGLWLKHFDRSIFQQVALAFSLTAPFFSYQIPMNLMFRSGQLAWVARRHYGFIAYSLLFAGLSLLVKSLPIYLSLLVCAEVLLSISFFGVRSGNVTVSGGCVGTRSIRLAALMTGLILLVWLTIHNDFGGFFLPETWRAISVTVAAFTMLILAMALGLYLSYQSDVRFLRGSRDLKPSVALTE